MNPLFHPVLAQQNSGGGPNFIVLIVIYLLATVPIYQIAQRLNQDNAWFAFVPILNLFLMASMAGKEWWWVLLMLIPLINIIILIILWMAIAENLGHPSWLGILMIIPLVNLALMYYLAFGPQPAVR